jgi:hypothetical protein
MRYYARLAEYENVRDQYARLQRELAPDGAPSAETAALYHELLVNAPAGANAHSA